MWLEGSGMRSHTGGKGKTMQDHEGHLKSLFQGQWGTINILLFYFLA